VDEILSSQRIWLNCAQQTFFDSGKVKQLNVSFRLFEDEFSLMRSQTRLCEATELNHDVKFPVLLPNDHHVTKLIIRDAHEEVMHSGKESTLNRVRLKFWIIKGRQTVSKVVNCCNLCKQWKFRNLKATPMSNLPGYRVCSEYPFQSTGIDYAGPLWV